MVDNSIVLKMIKSIFVIISLKRCYFCFIRGFLGFDLYWKVIEGKRGVI